MPQLGCETIVPDLLFHQYVEVLNRVLGGRRGRLYRRLLNLSELALGQQTVAVGVYRQDRGNPEHWYTLVVSGGRIDITENTKDPNAKFTMKVKASYLEEVVENADEYVARPVKLLVDRLKSRIGLD